MFETNPPINFSYDGAIYIKEANGSIKFKGYDASEMVNYEQISLSDAIIESKSIEGTPLWNLIYNPNYDVTSIFASGNVIKIKNYFIRENDNCSFFLSGDKIFIKVIITNGDIDEYETLPSRSFEKEGSVAIAWVCKNNQNIELRHKCAKEENLW